MDDPGHDVPEDSHRKAGKILRNISIAAHEYAKSKTTVLTSLLGRPTDASKTLLRDSEWTPKVEETPTEVYKTRLFRRPVPAGPPYSTPFEKDLARIVHSASFRKLQGKTQLIPSGENYFFRTRLTHSLEVAEIATRIALKLHDDGDLGDYKINSYLIQCAALLHDIGHPPFGHSGEEVLNQKMENYGGFEGNAQTLRLVTSLENRLGQGGIVQSVYDKPRGLNLTIGTLAAILKYDRKYDRPHYNDRDELVVTKGYYPEEEEIVRELKERLGIERSRRLYTIECQIMDVADDIAYSAYDLEDTMEAGIVTPFDFFSVYDDTLERITTHVNSQLTNHGYTSVEAEEVLRELGRVFETILQDADTAHPYDLNSRERGPIERMVFVGRSHNEAVLHAQNALIRRQFLETLIESNVNGISVEIDREKPFMSRLSVSRPCLLRIECMKAFNFYKVISSRKLQIPHHRSAQVVGSLFDILEDDKEGRLLSDVERDVLKQCGRDKHRRMRLICDIIASRTDSEAIRLFNRLSGHGNGSVFFDYNGPS